MKGIASRYIPPQITICANCFHRDVCSDKDYLTENRCSNSVDESLCAILPCKVGTNVAVVDSEANTVEICRVMGYEQYGSGKLEISVQNAPKHQEWYTLDCFGKTVFLTRAEAEAALKEVKQDG